MDGIVVPSLKIAEGLKGPNDQLYAVHVIK